MIERFTGSPVLIAKAPSAITKMECVGGRLFVWTAKHGVLELLEGHRLVPILVVPPTSQARH